MSKTKRITLNRKDRGSEIPKMITNEGARGVVKTHVNAEIARPPRLLQERDDKSGTTDMVLRQMARNSTLLPEALETDILNRSIPPLQDIVTALLIGALDCHFAVVADDKSTWNEKRLSRAVLTNNFLSALALVQGMEQVPEKIVNAAPGGLDV